MLFNSLDYALFLPIVFILYWFLFHKNLKIQNVFLLLASYFFYACWSSKFLGLIILSTLINYFFGLLISKAKHRSKLYLSIGIVLNLVILGYFKYFNFFIDNLIALFRLFGTEVNLHPLQIILPIGISFYTFQGISYLTDIYRKQTEACKDYLSFSIFITFFPQLVAGPIERASNLLPQITSKRIFNPKQAIVGLKLIALGLFEKIVIADNCAVYVNSIFENYEHESGSTLFFGAVLFSFQIYGDFCGYSHIAIGSANLFGFNLTKNFNYPYLAQNIADFWRRWHISFSYWLRDYIYSPLGGNKKGEYKKIRNLTIVFLISGIWHGADWTFVIYGGIHALLYILFIYYRKWTKNLSFLNSNPIKSLYDFLAIITTFLLLTLARIFFRADNLEDALGYFKQLSVSSLFEKPDVSQLFIALLFGFLFLEWIQRDKEHLLDLNNIKSKTIRYSIYFIILFLIFFNVGNNQSFIYFQF